MPLDTSTSTEETSRVEALLHAAGHAGALASMYLNDVYGNDAPDGAMKDIGFEATAKLLGMATVARREFEIALSDVDELITEMTNAYWNESESRTFPKVADDAR